MNAQIHNHTALFFMLSNQDTLNVTMLDFFLSFAIKKILHKLH